MLLFLNNSLQLAKLAIKKLAVASFCNVVQRLIMYPNRKVFIGYGYFVARVKIK